MTRPKGYLSIVYRIVIVKPLQWLGCTGKVTGGRLPVAIAGSYRFSKKNQLTVSWREVNSVG